VGIRGGSSNDGGGGVGVGAAAVEVIAGSFADELETIRSIPTTVAGVYIDNHADPRYIRATHGVRW
jgi:hypothetical protein